MTGRGHFAFFSFPRFGHLRPTLLVVRELRNRGHRVSYVVAEQFADLVAGAGATPVRYRSSFPVTVPLIRTADVLAEVTAAYLREAVAPLPAAWPVFGADPPDVVVEDALSTAASRLVAERDGCPVVRGYPGLAGNDQVPVNGSEPDTDLAAPDPGHPALAALGQEIPALLEPLGLDHGRIEQALIGPPGPVAANLVFVPKAFQPRAECFGDSFAFVGPGDDLPAPRTRWRRPPDAARVALVSLGTSANPNPAFFNNVAAAFAGTGWHLLLATGRHLDAAAARLPSHVEVHEWLDYEAVLPHVDVMVCQGGTGSLMDAFRHGVPVVVVPQSQDTRALAEQVAALGLGRYLPADCTGADVFAAASAVAGDPATTREVDRMRSAIQEAGGPARAASLLERLMPPYPSIG